MKNVKTSKAGAMLAALLLTCACAPAGGGGGGGTTTGGAGTEVPLPDSRSPKAS